MKHLKLFETDLPAKLQHNTKAAKLIKANSKKNNVVSFETGNGETFYLAVVDQLWKKSLQASTHIPEHYEVVYLSADKKKIAEMSMGDTFETRVEKFKGKFIAFFPTDDIKGVEEPSAETIKQNASLSSLSIRNQLNRNR